MKSFSGSQRLPAKKQDRIRSRDWCPICIAFSGFTRDKFASLWNRKVTLTKWRSVVNYQFSNRSNNMYHGVSPAIADSDDELNPSKSFTLSYTKGKSENATRPTKHLPWSGTWCQLRDQFGWCFLEQFDQFRCLPNAACGLKDRRQIIQSFVHWIRFLNTGCRSIWFAAGWTDWTALECDLMSAGRCLH